MRRGLKYILFILFLPTAFVAQDKKVSSERLEIVGKWSSYSSMDTTKIEVIEFRPDGSFVEYKDGVPKHSDTKYVLYKDELTMKSTKSDTKAFTMKFRVQKLPEGLFLETISVNELTNDKIIWVKLFPWKKQK
jgi:hypothetical protein